MNAAYIQSAATEDGFRQEPSFKLQGPHRNRSKILAAIQPIMNEMESTTFLLEHYQFVPGLEGIRAVLEQRPDE